MAKKRYPLTPTTPTQIVGLEFEAGICLVYNPTGSPIYLRVGAPEIPRGDNADYVIPANSGLTISVVGKEFGITFADITLITTLNTGNLGTRALIQFQTPDEPVPQFGAANFLSLSVSDLTNGFVSYSGPTASQLFNITPWGGALVYVNPSAGSGQTVLTILTSNDGVVFNPIGTFTLWPNVPAILTIPRVAHTLLLQFNATAIAGEPAIAGTYSVRATLSEIQDLTYNVSSQPITKTFNLAANGSQQWQFVTVGLPAVSIAAISTVGSGTSAVATLLVEASADLVNWRRVTFRTQRMSQGITLYRAVGNLDLFIRVTVFEVGGVSALVGSLYLSIPKEADLAYIMNTIQQTLGDPDNPSNTNQDIWHELDNIRGGIGTINTNLQPDLHNISSNAVYLPLIRNDLDQMVIDLHTVSSNAVYLPLIRNDLDQMLLDNASYSSTNHVDLTQLHGDIGISNSHLNTIESYISFLQSINTTLNSGVTHADLTQLHTDLSTLLANQDGNATHLSGSTVVAAGAWLKTTTQLPVGSKIIGLMASISVVQATASANVAIGYGTTVAVTNDLYNAGVNPTGPFVHPVSERSGGWEIPTVGGFAPFVYVLCSLACTVYWDIWISP